MRILYNFNNGKFNKLNLFGTGFKDKQKALDTLKIIKNRNIIYQKHFLKKSISKKAMPMQWHL